jgi:integral membrane protein
MKKYFNTSVGRLRLLGLLEGLSLIILVFIAVPVKYLGQNPGLVKAIGPIHGVLFLLFVINAISVSISEKWKFSETTWKVLISCLIPFGTFYVDRTILSRV